MHSTGTYLKKAAAALLLGLFAFILAEKNTHEHTRYATEDLGGQTMVHQPSNCLICDFQLAADADLPAITDLPHVSIQIPVFHQAPTGQFHTANIEALCLRGPPAAIS